MKPEFKIDTAKLPPALRAQIDNVLKEMHKRNRIHLVDHVLFAERHRNILHAIADFVFEESALDVNEMRDIIKAAVVTYALDDLINGAEKITLMMAFTASWAEKLELIRLASIESEKTEH